MKRRRGFAIVSAIFILVVLAALGAFILSVSSSQQIGSALDLQGVRAYQAARAGIEWGLYQRLQGTWKPAPLPAADPCSTLQTSPVPLPSSATTLSAFTVTVSCEAAVDSNNGPTVATITATACSTATCPNTTAPGNFYIERRLEVLL